MSIDSDVMPRAIKIENIESMNAKTPSQLRPITQRAQMCVNRLPMPVLSRMNVDTQNHAVEPSGIEHIEENTGAATAMEVIEILPESQPAMLPPRLPRKKRQRKLTMVADITSSSNCDILFRTSKTDRNSTPMFIKPPGSTDVNLKMFYNGTFIELDEARCLQWMQENAWRIARASAIDLADASRRSGRIAGLQRINYDEFKVKKPRRKRN